MTRRHRVVDRSRMALIRKFISETTPERLANSAIGFRRAVLAGLARPKCLVAARNDSPCSFTGVDVRGPFLQALCFSSRDCVASCSLDRGGRQRVGQADVHHNGAALEQSSQVAPVRVALGARRASVGTVMISCTPWRSGCGGTERDGRPCVADGPDWLSCGRGSGGLGSRNVSCVPRGSGCGNSGDGWGAHLHGRQRRWCGREWPGGDSAAPGSGWEQVVWPGA